MAAGYLNYPQPYYNGPIFTVTSGNDIGRIENPLIGNIEPCRTERQRPVRLTILTVVSIFFNLLLAAAIAWSLASHFVDKENIKIPDLSTPDTVMSGTVGLLRSMTSKRPCEVSLSSAVCMPCLISLHSTLLWNGKVVKVRAGKTDLCCRRIEHSLRRLTEEIRDVHRKYEPSHQQVSNKIVSDFFYIDQDNVGVDLGRLPLLSSGNQKKQTYSTKIDIRESGLYKLIVAITTVANATVCNPSEVNFIRVVSEEPDRGSTILLQREWKSPEDLSAHTMLPLELVERFHFVKDTIVYVEVKNRLQIYPYTRNNYVVLLKM